MDRDKERFFAIDLDDEVKLNSSPRQVEKFAESSVWQDMVTLLREHKSFLHAQLRQAEDMPKVRGIQYSLDEIDEMLRLPQRLIGAIEEQKRTEQKKQEQESK